MDAEPTIISDQWIRLHPERQQALQFVRDNYLDGAPAQGLEVPGRRTVFMEGASRFVEDTQGASRETIVWDRARDRVVDEFLNGVEAEVRNQMGIRRLDPASPTFERDLQRVLARFMVRLRAEFRRPGEPPEQADERLNAFSDQHRGEGLLVGDILRQQFPFCRHLALMTQAFLTDLGLQGVRMQRGRVPDGAHVWNEMVVGGRRRIIEATGAFYNDAQVLQPVGSEADYHPETRSGRVQ
jgi:hypothetical protein